MLMKRMMTMMTRAIDEAVELLRDENLIWSYDIQNIKGDIIALLLVSAAQGDLMQTLADNLARKICHFEEEQHVATYDPNLEKRDA
jgi:hypothetical protein